MGDQIKPERKEVPPHKDKPANQPPKEKPKSPPPPKMPKK